jgi:hypothetical protein
MEDLALKHQFISDAHGVRELEGNVKDLSAFI